MAVTISTYNGAIAHLLDVGADGMSVKVELLDNNATFTATHTAKDSVDNTGAYEVSGNGWAAGGQALTVVSTLVTTNDAIVDGTDIDVTATGDVITAYKALVYDDTDASDKPLFFVDFGEVQTAGVGTSFKFTLNVDGLMKVSIT